MLLCFYASDTRKIAYQYIYISLTFPYAADCYYAFRAVAIFVSPNMRQITDVQYAETGTITNSISVCRQVVQYDKVVLYISTSRHKAPDILTLRSEWRYFSFTFRPSAKGKRAYKVVGFA